MPRLVMLYRAQGSSQRIVPHRRKRRSGGRGSGRGRAGVCTLAKATGAITAGARVHSDNTAKNVTTTASGNWLIGAATAAAASGDTNRQCPARWDKHLKSLGKGPKSVETTKVTIQ